MKNTFKQRFAFLLALTMLLSTIPTTALAVDEELTDPETSASTTFDGPEGGAEGGSVDVPESDPAQDEPVTYGETDWDAAKVKAEIEKASSGDTVTIPSSVTLTDTITVPEGVTVTAAEDVTITVTGGNTIFDLEAGSTLSGLTIKKTDSVNQNSIVYVRSDCKVTGCNFSGQYEDGSEETSRAFVIEGDASKYEITKNVISDLRQPAYINASAGTISENEVSGTRGWVVCCDSDVDFKDNIFKNNAVDFAIIKPNQNQEPSEVNYLDLAALSEANSGAYAEHQIKKASAEDGKYFVDADNANATLDGALELAEDGDTILLKSDVEVDKMLNITTSGITLDLDKNTITASADFESTWSNKNDAHLVQINGAKNVIIRNGTLEATSANKHVLNVYGGASCVVENLELDHSAAATGAPMVVNASDVSVQGKLEMVTGDKSWYAMNVDNKNGQATVTFEEKSNVIFGGSAKEGIKIESSGGTVAFKEKVSITMPDGVENFIPVKDYTASQDAVQNPGNAGLKPGENGSFVEDINEKNGVASIGDTYYKTLDAALAAAKDGDTIKLAAREFDVGKELRLTKAVSIQGAGEGQTTIIGAINYYCEDYDGTIKVSDLTVEAPDDNTTTQQAIWWSYNTKNPLDGATLVVENCTIKDYLFGIGVNSSTKNCKLSVTGLTLDNVWCGANVSEGAGNTISAFDVTADSTVAYEVQVFGAANAVEKNAYYETYEDCAADPTRANPALNNNDSMPDLGASDWPAAAVVDGKYYGTIQKAIDAAAENAVIEVLPGTYNENLKITESVTIKGAGQGKTVLKSESGSYIIEVKNPGQNIGTLIIEDLTLDGENKVATLVKVDSQTTYDEITFNRVTFQNATGSGINVASGEVASKTGKMVVSDCDFNQIGGGEASAYGIYTTRGNLEVTKSNFDGIKSASGTAAGILFDTANFGDDSYDLIVKNNEFSNIQGTESMDKGTGGVTVTGSNQIGTLTVEENEFQNNTYDIHIGKKDGTPAIDNVNISNNGDASIVVPNEEAEYFTATFMNDGEVYAKVVTEEDGSFVTPEAPEKSGYTFRYWQDEDGNTYNAEEKVTITEDMTFEAVWRKKSSGGGSSSGSSSSSSSKYDIDLGKFSNGEVELSDDEAKKGDKITITVTPDEGYELDSIAVYDEDGDEIKLTDKGDGKYTFTMPAGDVEIEVSFSKIGEDKGAHPFADVAANAWYAPAVQYVWENDLMKGVSDTTFAPSASFTRAMIAQVLYNLSNPTDTAPAGVFTDVAAGQWYTDVVNWAAWQGYMNGYANGAFGSNDAVTRQDLITTLWRYSGTPAASETALTIFPDANLVSDYAQQAMAWAYEKGVIGGNTDGTLNPRGTATRAEVAQILMNFCEKVQ